LQPSFNLLQLASTKARQTLWVVRTTTRLRQVFAIVLVAMLAGCHKNPAAPSTPAPSGPTTFTLNGKIVTPDNNGTPISGATATIVDGPEAGKTATTAATGFYSISGLQQTTFTIRVVADGFVTATTSVTVRLAGVVLSSLQFTSLTVFVGDAIVFDDIVRPVPAAHVTLLDGPQAGGSAITDDSGMVLIAGSFDGQAKIRVEKDGYTPIETTAQIGSFSPRGAGWLSIELKTPDLLQLGPGEYTLTVATGGNCPGVPADVQTRVYTGVVAPFTGTAAATGIRSFLTRP
jgi:carboxypeptidase family protein